MVAGHPFKGGMYLSTGYLMHPDMKRFEINDSTLFLPPNPFAWATAAGMGAMAPKAEGVPSFGDFFATYFAGKSYSCHEAKCNTMLEGLKKCWENHASKNPQEQCAYYIQGFERVASTHY